MDTSPIVFLLNMAGAASLLIWAVIISAMTLYGFTQ